MPRKTPNQKKRQYKYRFAEAQGHLCEYCSEEFSYLPPPDPGAVTHDHVVPVSAGGGGYTLQNGVAACFRCNNVKADLDALRFQAFVLYCKEHNITISHQNLKDWL